MNLLRHLRSQGERWHYISTNGNTSSFELRGQRGDSEGRLWTFGILWDGTVELHKNIVE